MEPALSHLLQKLNAAPMTVYTYTGDPFTHEPVYYEEVKLFRRLFSELKISWPIVEVTDRDFDPEKWDPNTSLLHIPGAPASALDNHLGFQAAKIKAFVEKGGCALLWCGGGYWRCQGVVYQVDETTTLRKIREYSLWKGLEVGPLLPKGDGYFHGAVKVSWLGSKELQDFYPEGFELFALLSGGGFFVPDPDEYPFRTLAYYSEPPSRACVKTFIGKGTATFMNPYFTHGAPYFSPSIAGYEEHFPEHPWQEIVSRLENSAQKIELCFVDTLWEAIQKQNN